MNINNHLYRFIIILTLVFGADYALAQTVKVNSQGEGNTRENAIHHALREALERTYNSFISSNTLFANDEIVSDEIVSITRGNIVKYEVLYERFDSISKMHNVMVESIVSLDKFKDYSKSHGATVEIDGASLASSLIANEKMKRFNTENEVVAVKNFVLEMEQMCKNLYEYTVKVKIPENINSGISILVIAQTNMNLIYCFRKMYDMLNRLSNNQGAYRYFPPSFRASSYEQSQELAKLYWVSYYREKNSSNNKQQSKFSKFINNISSSGQLACPACGKTTYARLDRYSYTHSDAIGECSSRKCGYKVTPEQWRKTVSFISGSHFFNFLNPESVELLKKYIGAYSNNSNFGLIWNSKYRIVDNNGKVYSVKTIELSNKILPPLQLRNNVKLNLSMDDLSSIKTFTVEPIFESVDQKLKQINNMEEQKKRQEREKLKKMRQSIGYKY